MRYHFSIQTVLDTSVLVAAIRSNEGASHQLVRAAIESRFELLLSVPLALEYEAVLKRPEHLKASGGTTHEIDKLLDALIAAAKPVYRAFFWRPLLRDANDDMVLETAMSGHADSLITFNERDFEPVASELGIAVVSPQEALREIRSRDEDK